MSEGRDKELREVYWDLAIAWKLYDTAVRERRFDDANYYAQQREVAEIRARALLDMPPSRSFFRPRARPVR